MYGHTGPRFQHFIDQDHKVLVVRVIGDMPHSEMADNLFDVYAKLGDPWNWSRIIDFRRFEGVVTIADIEDVAQRWAELTRGQEYRSKYAVVSLDPLEKLRVPAASALFPNETVCHFSDYHEALAWVRAD